MPTFTTVIKDTSPLLIYNGSWAAGNSSDAFLSSYSQTSFMMTSAPGSSMTFAFFGSSVSIYGSKRLNHGSYYVKLDDQTFPQANGFSQTELFNQALFSKQVGLGFHNVSIINDLNSFLDIDYVSYDTSVGLPAESLIVNTYQDTHPAFTYQPSSSWSTSPQVGTFSGSSGHATEDTSAIATLTFQVRNAVGLYGPVGPNNTPAYSVTVDNNPQMTLTAQNQYYRPKQMLFYAGNLTAGTHTLKIQTQIAPGMLAIDYAEVYTSESLGGSFGSSVVVQAPAASPRISPGLIAGLSITSALAFLSTTFLIWLIFRGRPRQSQDVAGAAGRPEMQNSTFVAPFDLSREESRSTASVKKANLKAPVLLPKAASARQSSSYANPSEPIRPPANDRVTMSTPGPSVHVPAEFDDADSSGKLQLLELELSVT